MRRQSTETSRWQFALIGLIAGALIGLILALFASYILDSFPIRAATIAVDSLVLGFLGWKRGAEIGDLFGMFIHAIYQATATEITHAVHTPGAPKGTYRPWHLAWILAGLTVLALVMGRRTGG